MSPRTFEQFQEMRDQSKGKILQSALALFANKGYFSTTIAQLAKQAKVSKGLIYNYFTGKEDILKELVQLGFEEIDRVSVESESINDPVEKLRRQLDLFAELLSDNEVFWKLYTHLLAQPTVVSAVNSRLKTFFDDQLNQMGKLLDKIGFKDPALEARVLAALLDGIGFHYFIDNDYPLDDVLAHLKDKYCGGK